MQFSGYSQYYDLLYRDKDYAGETHYLARLLERFLPSSSRLLELGCGTGRHAVLLAEQGFHVVGVEVSESMLSQAKERAICLIANVETKGRFEPHSGDARTFRIEKPIDAVISLFHVVSYQTTNDDVRQMFDTAAVHLTTGGIFMFDVWYGPAVVSLRPAVRVKRMENDQFYVLRIAEPELNLNRNQVDVKYTVMVTEKSTGNVAHLTEQHHMRYYFAPELELLALAANFEIVHSEEWMTAAQPSEKTWGVTFIARKI